MYLSDYWSIQKLPCPGNGPWVPGGPHLGVEDPGHQLLLFHCPWALPRGGEGWGSARPCCSKQWELEGASLARLGLGAVWGQGWPFSCPQCFQGLPRWQPKPHIRCTPQCWWQGTCSLCTRPCDYHARPHGDHRRGQEAAWPQWVLTDVLSRTLWSHVALPWCGSCWSPRWQQVNLCWEPAHSLT